MGPVRPVRWTGQTGWLDRLDRCQGPARPVGLQHPLYTISSDGRGSFFETKILRDAAILMKIRYAVLEGPRNPGRWPILRKPPKLLTREDSRLHAVALDAVPASAF